MPNTTSIPALKKKADAFAQKSKEIQAQIRKVENERCLKIGKHVAKLHAAKWQGFDQAKFQAFVKQTLET